MQLEGSGRRYQHYAPPEGRVYIFMPDDRAQRGASVQALPGLGVFTQGAEGTATRLKMPVTMQ